VPVIIGRPAGSARWGGCSSTSSRPKASGCAIGSHREPLDSDHAKAEVDVESLQAPDHAPFTATSAPGTHGHWVSDYQSHNPPEQ